MRTATLTALMISLCAPALAQKAAPPQKVMDAFQRQIIVTTAERDPLSGKLTLDVEGKLACYPNGTAILLTVHYIQGETSKEHPFGDPKRNSVDGTSRRIASTNVIVRDWRYQARFNFDKYCPPGEYVVTGFYRLSAQSRKLQRQFRQEYVPPKERKNPCQFCRFHYGMAKVAIEDPKFKLRPAFAALKDVPLWLKQKRDYVDRLISTYKDWYAQVLGARETMRNCAREILQFGPTERAGVDEEVLKIEASAQREMHAILSWKAIASGLRACSERLRKNERLPDNPHRYWRLAAYGEGHLPQEDMRDPSPPRNSPDRAWSRNYVVPRLQYVEREMLQHNRDVGVLILPSSFYEIRNLSQRVRQLVMRTDRQIDIAVETVLIQKRLEALQRADEQSRAAHSKTLIDAFYEGFQKLHSENAKASREMAKELARMGKSLMLDLSFPIACWPLPESIARAPQNSPEQQRDRMKGLKRLKPGK